MTSQVIYTTIDETYPVAGQDNDSQGFRDNFNIIKTALQETKTELTDLQTKALLKGSLTVNGSLSNNLGGNRITNGTHTNFFGESLAATATGVVSIDVTAGDIQIFTLSTNTTFTFTNWPASGTYACIRVHLLSNTSNTFTATLGTQSGSIVPATGLTLPISVTSAGEHHVIEAWTWTGSTDKKVYVRSLGTY